MLKEQAEMIKHLIETAIKDGLTIEEAIEKAYLCGFADGMLYGISLEPEPSPKQDTKQ